MKAAADEAQTVVDSKSLSDADKKAKLSEVEAKIQHFSAQIAAHEQAKSLGLLGGAGTYVPGGSFIPALTKGIAAPRRTAPLLNMPRDTMQSMFDAMKSHKSFKAEIGTKAATSGAGLSDGSIPQYGGFVEMAHEPVRVFDLIPNTATESPVIEVVRHDSTTGAAGTVLPGTLKPTATLNTSRQEVRVQKIAVLATVNDEDLLDFPSFQQYIGAELTRLVIDQENQQVLYGNGTAPNLLGLLSQTGILTRAQAASPATALDTIEEAISDLRVGPAFVADPTAIIINPATWSLIRRSKDSQGRYLVNPDPTVGEASSLWGVPVYPTTSVTAGEALIADMQLGAAGFVRQGITVEADYGQLGFEQNQHTIRVEMRLAVYSPRPPALMHVTDLA